MAKLDRSDHFFSRNSLFSMEFFKVKRFRGAHKTKTDKDADRESYTLPPEESKAENVGSSPKSTAADSSMNMEDDDDDDFITNEVKRRLKELRKNSFMVLIPEESCPEEEEDEEGSSSSEWREQTVVDGYPWCGFDTLYDKYTERMLFFDKMSAQQLQDAGSLDILNPSPKSSSKKLASTLRNLSFKRKDVLQDDVEHLQPQQKEVDPYQNLEIIYVAQICLTWEALLCQYMQLSQKISSQPENPTCYNYAAQAFQQFQVLLQRFIENEPFEHGSRVEVYVRTRKSLPKLLQAPSFQATLGSDHKEQVEDDLDAPVLASDLIKAIEESIMTFCIFLKRDKKKSNGGLGVHNQDTHSLQQLQASVDKKEVKLKELFRKKKGWKKKLWPDTQDDVDLMFGLIDIKVVSRVLRMVRISNEQLLWCEEKMSKLDLSENKLHRDGSPVLFPC